MALKKNVRFVSHNHRKIDEAKSILTKADVEVIAIDLELHEIQTDDISKLVRDKLIKAFKQVGRPLFVEHTGLSLRHLGGLPGGLTQVFWDKLQADRFAELFGKLAPDKSVIATTTVAYCDGLKIHCFDGSVNGTIVAEPRGGRTFQWDCVFQPDGYDKTFAELGDEKNKISMRRMALDKFSDHLRLS